MVKKTAQKPIIQFRQYQEPAFWCAYRMLFLLWCRQKGKSFTLSSAALKRMMEEAGHLCVFVSASVSLGAEFIRKEAEVWRIVTEAFRKQAEDGNLLLTTNADDDKGQLLDIDVICDLFEHSKLETRIHHSRTIYSRSRVVAPNPDTAVGWTGDIYMDEVGRMPEFKDLFEAVLPIMESNPGYRCWMATTPPPDDNHYSFEMFLPPEDDFTLNPRGNWYDSPAGIPTHRVSCDDAYESGVTFYHPRTGDPITPDAHRALAFDKSAWDRNHRVKFIAGGTSAIPLAAIQRAMVAGRDQCLGIAVTEPVIL